MNKNIFYIITLSFTLGCSLFPGGDVPLKNKKIISEVASPNENSGQLINDKLLTDVLQSVNNENDRQFTDNVNVYKITPLLVEKLKNLAAYNKANSAEQRPALSTNKADYRYRIGAGDILSINVWHAELLNGNDFTPPPNTTVDNKGDIYYPHVGNLSVSGKTVSQVRKIISKRLKKYLKNPQVEVKVASFESKKVYVTGEVKKPGVLKMTTAPITVMDALNLSGGLTDNAKWNSVTLNRKNSTYPVPLMKILQKGNLKYNYLLRDGDILNIPRNDKDKVYLMGEVIKPQVVGIGRYGLSLTAALTTAGGINEKQADPTGIFVIRNEQESLPDNSKLTNINIYQLNAKDMTALALGEQFQLISGDVIYVTAAPVSKWNRVISNILPSLSGVSTTKGIIK